MNISIQQIPLQNNKIIKRFTFDKSLLNSEYLQWDNVITNLYDLKTEVIRWWRWNKNWLVFNRLKSLQGELEYEYQNKIDPIEYILQLYYWENLSIQSIYDRLNQKWLGYKNASWLEKMLLKVLKWELKDPFERFDTRKQRNKWLCEKAKNEWIRKEEEHKAIFLSFFIKNFIELDPPNFDMDVYNSMQNLNVEQKWNYLLKSFYWEWFDKFKASCISGKVILKYITPIIDEITDNLWLDRLKMSDFWIYRFIHPHKKQN